MDRKAGDEHMGKFVYCKQHLSPHSTGWCSVSPREKVPLEGETIQEAAAHAKKLGLLKE